MVRCCNNDCHLGSWFHAECLNIELPSPSEDWFCSEECREEFINTATTASDEPRGTSEDHVRNYALSVIWCGLLDMVHRDAVREADGLAMMSMWRCNMLRFWGGRHFKYLIVGHRLLAGF